MKQVQAQLDALVKGRVASSLDVREIERLAQVATKVQKAFISAGLDKSKALDSFDESFSQLMHSYEVTQKEYAAAIAAGNKEAAELQQQQLQNIQKGLQGMVDVASTQIEAPFASKQNMAKAGVALSDGFVSSLDKLKSGDLTGISKAIFGGGAKLALKASKFQGAKSAAAGAGGDAEAAAALASSAKMLGTVAVGLGGVAAAVGVVIALLVAADDRQKELNKTILEGSGIADWSYGSSSNAAAELAAHLEEVSDASRRMSYEFGGDAKEYAAAFSALQAGGLTFKEMNRTGNNALTTIRNITTDARAMGLSLTEAAQTYGELNDTFGLGQDQIHERFMEIASAAAYSTMGTKRFFTAVSQATSGMALYNVRMEEAAELLAITSKILGGADASDFIKSLTKGFTEETYQESLKRVLIAGKKDVRDVFSGEVSRAAKAFAKDFGKQAPMLQQALADSGSTLDVSVFGDSTKLTSTMAAMTNEDRSALIYELQETRTDEGRAMALQIQELDRLIKATEGGYGSMLRGLDVMGMQGKMALMFQRLGDDDNKRISQLSAEQLIAYSETSGLSRDQIMKLSLIEDNLRAQYAESTEGYGTFAEFVAKADLTNNNLEEVMATSKSADDYAAEIATNTVTMADRLGMIFEELLRSLRPMASMMSALVARFTTGFLGIGTSTPGDPAAYTDTSSMDADAQANSDAQEELVMRLAELQASIGGASGDEEKKRLLEEQAAATKELDGLREEAAQIAQGIDPRLAKEQAKDQADALALAEKSFRTRQEQTKKATLEALLDAKRRELAGTLAVATNKDYSTVLADLEQQKFGSYQAQLTDPAMRAKAVELGLDPMAHDFVSRPGQAAQRFSPNDTLVGLKSGGPLDNVLKGGGGNVTIHINGGDMGQVYRTVRSAIKTSKG